MFRYEIGQLSLGSGAGGYLKRHRKKRVLLYDGPLVCLDWKNEKARFSVGRDAALAQLKGASTCFFMLGDPAKLATRFLKKCRRRPPSQLANTTRRGRLKAACLVLRKTDNARGRDAKPHPHVYASMHIAGHASPPLLPLHSQETRATSPHNCLLYTSPSPRDKRQSRMPSSA